MTVASRDKHHVTEGEGVPAYLPPPPPPRQSAFLHNAGSFSRWNAGTSLKKLQNPEADDDGSALLSITGLSVPAKKPPCSCKHTHFHVNTVLRCFLSARKHSTGDSLMHGGGGGGELRRRSLVPHGAAGGGGGGGGVFTAQETCVSRSLAVL